MGIGHGERAHVEKPCDRRLRDQEHWVPDKPVGDVLAL